MKLIINRDEITTASPAPNQVSVGELVMNSVTGKLYTKLTDGTVVEFISQRICYGSVPAISFSDSYNFCCYGDILYINIKELQPEPTNYSFSFEELTGNSSVISIGPPNYTPYFASGINGIPSGQIVSLREASIPVDITMTSPDSINIFKFALYSDNNKITETTTAITCSVCN